MGALNLLLAPGAIQPRYAPAGEGHLLIDFLQLLVRVRNG